MHFSVKTLNDNTINVLRGDEQYKCNCCDVDISGAKQVQDHLVGAKHEKNLKWQLSQAMSAPTDHADPVINEALQKHILETCSSKGPSHYKCIVCPKNISGESQVIEHLKGTKHQKSLCLNAQFADIKAPSVPIDHAGHNIIKEALQKRILEKTPSKGPSHYECIVCPKNISGENQVLQHLKGTRHQKSLSLQTQFASMEFQESNTKSIYPLESKPLGIVVVFNNIFRDHKERKGGSYREGAEKDSEQVETTFKKLDYHVQNYEDKTKEETKEIIDELRLGNTFNNVDSFICFILSHGLNNTKIQTYTPVGKARETMDIDDFMLPFKNSNCPSLINKPKIFFANFCRGNKYEKKVTTTIKQDLYESDSFSEEEDDAPTDMVTFYATTKDKVSLRDSSAGAVFVTSICETLKKFSDLELTGDFRMHIDEEMQKRNATTTEMQITGFKKFIFKHNK